MKLSKFVLVFIFILSLFVSTQASAEEKIGYVDLSILFDEYYKTKEFDAMLEQKHNGYEAEKQAKLEKLQEAQGKLALLKEDKKAELEGQIEQMRAELVEYDQQQKTTLTKERNEKIRDILLEIEKVVSTYAEKEEYSIILNDRVLIYGQQTHNLTEKILNILNAGQE